MLYLISNKEFLINF
jgi:hypothetical protein